MTTLLETLTGIVREKAIDKVLDTEDDHETDWTVVVPDIAYEEVERAADTLDEHVDIIEDGVGSGHLSDYDSRDIVDEHYNGNRDDPLRWAIQGAAATVVQHAVLDDLDELGL